MVELVKRNFGFLTKTERDFIIGSKEVSAQYRKTLNYRLREVLKRLVGVHWIDFCDDARLIVQWANSKQHLTGLKDSDSFKLLQYWGKWGTPKSRSDVMQIITKDGEFDEVKFKTQAVTVPIECPYCHQHFDKTFREKYPTTTFYPKIDFDNENVADKE